MRSRSEVAYKACLASVDSFQGYGGSLLGQTWTTRVSAQAKKKGPARQLLKLAERAVTGIGDPQALVDHLPIGVFVYLVVGPNRFDRILTNRFYEQLFGLNRRRTDPQTPPPEGDWAIFGPLKSQMELARQSKRTVSFDWQIQDAPMDRHMTCQVNPITDADGHVIQLLGTVMDRSAERRAERNMMHNALHDPLTGLPNRVLFLDEVEGSIERLEKTTDQHIGVLLLNVDRFKLINESFGHVAGDEFLVTLASRLNGCMRQNDVLARLSGDEFAILVHGITESSQIVALADRIHVEMREPYRIGSNEIHSSVTIGIASTLTGTISAEDLVRDADFAMHSAKAKGKAQTQIYHRESHHRAQSLFQLETELRKALSNEELELYYQPIVDLRNGRITGVEALCRWNHPDRGWVSPGEFIPLAEETGLIVPLGRWALKESCLQLSKWTETYPDAKDVVMSVNVSGIQFAQDDIVGEVERALTYTKVDPSRLRVELTESALIENPDAARDILTRLREIGVEIAMDDFGTGYSSLNYLHTFPIDILKIDRSFIAEINGNPEVAKIVKTILMLAEAFDLRCVAEGIETEDQAKSMAGLGCHFGQGFFYARALPPEQSDGLFVDFVPDGTKE